MNDLERDEKAPGWKHMPALAHSIQLRYLDPVLPAWGSMPDASKFWQRQQYKVKDFYCAVAVQDHADIARQPLNIGGICTVCEQYIDHRQRYQQEILEICKVCSTHSSFDSSSEYRIKLLNALALLDPPIATI